jgi:hypothetical protein
MSEQIKASPELVIELFEQYLANGGIPEVEDWRSALRSAEPPALTGNPASKAYWVDLYRTRKEGAASRDDAGMAARLARVVGELSAFDSDTFYLVLINYSAFGYLIWLDGRLSSIVSCLRLTDRRTEPSQLTGNVLSFLSQGPTCAAARRGS